MSFPWSEKSEKSAGEDNDEVMILDSSVTDPETINKRLKLVNIPAVSGGVSNGSNLGSGSEVFAQKNGTILEFRTLLGETDKITLTQNTDDITFTLGSDVVTTDQANTYSDGAKQSFVTSTTIAGININTLVPSTKVVGDVWRTAEFIQWRGVSGFDRTAVITETVQTLTEKIIDADDNTISNLALGDEVTGASTDLTDSSNIPLLDVLNDFTAGTKSLFFQSEAGSPADVGIIRLANIESIAWKNTANTGNLLLSVVTNDFLKFNGFFVAATLSQGTSGEVLTSNGGGLLDPTFQDAASAVFPVADDVMIIEGNSDSSKQIRFEVDDNITSGTLRVITPPDSDIELVDTVDGFITNSNLTSGSFTNILGVGILTAGTWNANFITVPFGGTGNTTLTEFGVLFGNGTSAIGATDVGTSGQVLTSNAGVTAPTFQDVSIADIFPVSDDTVIIEGNATPSKQLKFEVDGNNPATLGTIATMFTSDKTITIPDATDTLVGLATADTLTNKVIDGGDNTIQNVDETQLTVAVGVSGTILTSNGVSVAPTYQAVPPNVTTQISIKPSDQTIDGADEIITGLSITLPTVTDGAALLTLFLIIDASQNNQTALFEILDDGTPIAERVITIGSTTDSNVSVTFTFSVPLDGSIITITATNIDGDFDVRGGGTNDQNSSVLTSFEMG